jgi:hypothetical protein
MKRNILWIFLVTAPLVSASSLGTFQAACSGAGCGGSYNGNTFGFGGPFPSGRVGPQSDPNFPYNPLIDFSIGTNGGSFTSGGNTCDYSVLLGGGNCYGEVSFGAYMGPPDDTGLSLGDVVSVKGTGSAEGFFCWDGDCPTGGPPPLFNLNVTATYQFTLTDPGTLYAFTWTGAEFSSVPEPGTWVFATLGLAGVAAGFRGAAQR